MRRAALCALLLAVLTGCRDVATPSQVRDAERWHAHHRDPPAPVATRTAADRRAAFPDAPGLAGSRSLGGRDGAVLHVTTLADDGPGSLRAAVDAPGPRVVVFDVAGTIELRRPLLVREGRLTIAGESAPGGGVCLKGAEVRIRADHVVVRHLRIRLGPVGRERGEDGLRVERSRFVVVDHCSLSWGVDETCSVVDSDGVAFSSCIVAEGLRRAGHEDGDHSMGMLVRGGRCLVVVGCLFMRNENRNPQVEEGSEVWVQRCLMARFRRGLRLNDLDDEEREGWVQAEDNRFVAPRKKGEEIVVDDTVTNAWLDLRGNVGPRGEDWALVSLENDGGREALRPPASCGNPSFAGGTFDLARVGALPRDACDARLVAEVEGGGPDVVDDPSEVGGWPALAPGVPEPDGDRDGVPDAWEVAHGTDPGAFDAWADPDGDGWSSLEAWLAERAAR